MCVDMAKGYNIKLPPPLTIKQQSKDFRFFQYLTGISKALRGHKGETKLLIHFSKKEYLNTNYRSINGLPDLFIRLCQKEIITSDNLKELYLYLEKAEDEDLSNAQKYLHAYMGSLYTGYGVSTQQPEGRLKHATNYCN